MLKPFMSTTQLLLSEEGRDYLNKCIKVNLYFEGNFKKDEPRKKPNSKISSFNAPGAKLVNPETPPPIHNHLKNVAFGRPQKYLGPVAKKSERMFQKWMQANVGMEAMTSQIEKWSLGESKDLWTREL